MDAKDIFVKIFFCILANLCARLALKLRKSANMSIQIIFAKIQLGYHKMLNLMHI
jgi:hypothetical protein